jgi:hypothetical protein
MLDGGCLHKYGVTICCLDYMNDGTSAGVRILGVCMAALDVRLKPLGHNSLLWNSYSTFWKIPYIYILIEGVGSLMYLDLCISISVQLPYYHTHFSLSSTLSYLNLTPIFNRNHQSHNLLLHSCHFHSLTLRKPNRLEPLQKPHNRIPSFSKCKIHCVRSATSSIHIPIIERI